MKVNLLITGTIIFWKGLNTVKKIIVLLTAVCLILCGCTAKQDKGNYTDEMKIPYAADLDTEYGADSVEREGAHKDSP